MYTLYSLPGAAGMAPRIVLEEAGAPYTMHNMDRAGGELTSPAYTALNPNQRVPTLVVGDPADGGYAVFESAAICQVVAEAYPAAGLLPAEGTRARALTLQWLTWATNTVQPDLQGYFRPGRFVPEADGDAFKTRLADRLMANFAIADAHLAGHEWLAGDVYTIADPFLFMLARWTRNMPRKARDFPHLGRFMAGVYARTAVQAVFTADKLDTDPAY